MAAEDLVGQQLGPYTIEAVIGSGGMSVVYRARNPQRNRVALKVLFPPPDTAAETLTRFEREAHTAARLNHPNLVPVLDAGQAEGRAYLAMAFIEGHTLSDRLGQEGHLDEATAADIAWQIADALYYAHGQGVVHRDIKPSNILLTAEGRAMLTDFGVAQALDNPALTRTGYTVGTPAYMSPEQAAGDKTVDGRSDLYSLGVVLYQMLTSRLPFQGGTPHVLHAHVYKTPPPPSTMAPVSPGMERIILRALAKEPDQRFQTGAALAHALDRLEDQTGVQVQPDPAGSTKSAAKQPGAFRPLWGVVILLLIVAAGAALAVWQIAGPAPTPTATLPPAVAVSTSIPVGQLTPSPSPTQTQTPTTLPPPTASPTPTTTPSPTTVPNTPSPLPPPTETPLILLDCPQPAAEIFVPLSAADFSAQLGCPDAEAITTLAAWQPFERGGLLWREDRNLIYILREDASWDFIGDSWQGQPEPPLDPDLAPPEDGLHVPVRGFGQLWREENLVTDLGWGLTPEVAFTATIQIFDTAQVWAGPDEGTFTLLFDDNTYQIIDETGVGE